LARGPDTRFLINHTGSRLARAPKTLTLKEDDGGLHFTATLDTRSHAAWDLGIAIERGDLDSASFAFRVGRDEWSKDRSRRTILEVAELSDVSAVTFPANEAASVSLVAQRQIAAMPVESRARLRRLYLDTRSGKPLSSANADHVAAAIAELYEILSGAGVNPRSSSAKVLEKELAKPSQPPLLASLKEELARRGIGTGRRMTAAELRARHDAANRRRSS